MTNLFNCIGLVGLPRKMEAVETHRLLYRWLIEQGYHVLVEDALDGLLPFEDVNYVSLDEVGASADLAIVIGGDGNMLRTARTLSHYDIKVIGVNRGTLGFLTDISPDNVTEQIREVLLGRYHEDPRFLLEVAIIRDQRTIATGFAVNEIVIHPSKLAHMVKYEVYINDRNAFSQRADGLIISTPTGSTAYSLSAGGPIIEPSLEALIVSPMFPHSLSSRPIVINSDSVIRLKFTTSQRLEVTCDSQIIIPTSSTNEIVIRRSPYKFNLIHSNQYDYFKNLSNKLGWYQSNL